MFLVPKRTEGYLCSTLESKTTGSVSNVVLVMISPIPVRYFDVLFYYLGMSALSLCCLCARSTYL
jgi:hypothetical protein